MTNAEKGREARILSRAVVMWSAVCSVTKQAERRVLMVFCGELEWRSGNEVVDDGLSPRILHQ